VVQAYGRAKNKASFQVEHLLQGKQEPTEDEVFNVILEINQRLISDGKSKGLLLILDELGKFLEFAALHPSRQDVFLLQRLAEAASRSRSEPLFVVCLLHQGFNAYADHLNQAAQREWEKIAGRFEEIVFNQPIEQSAQMIASAINVRTQNIPKTQLHELKRSMASTLQLGWFGAASRKTLVESASQLYPLHPTVLPALIRIFRRFGQNERSLFSFLLSNEPFGLQAFSKGSIKEDERYRLDNLYDYVRTNFGHRLAVQSYRSHWNLIDSVVESFATEDELQVSVLKTVGILNLLNDGDLLPTEESVVCALGRDTHNPDGETIRAALKRLQKDRRVLYDRGRARGLCLWPHTSVDLEKAYEDATRAVDAPRRVAAFIRDSLETRPIVARRHYIETGNLRHWDVQYCAVSDLEGLSLDDSAKADGLIVVPLCETSTEHESALKQVREERFTKAPNVLVGVPQPLSSLAGLVQEVQRWEWVSSNVMELNADKFAREEVSRQKSNARLQLEKRIQSFIGWKQLGGQMALEWFHCSRLLNLRDGRELLEKLSSICDTSYERSPRIGNELINRRTLSSAAAAARMRLIERMFTNANAPVLGMDQTKKPPEMSMYLSVLKRTGLHQQRGDTWRIAEPHPRNDLCGVLPALRKIRDIVQEKPDSRVNLSDVFKELRKAPYGVRDGVIPLLLTVFAISHEKDVAFYKDGTFLRELNGESMLLLTKAPERFDIQYCKIEGVRAELFEKLLTLLELKTSVDREVELLDVVKKLCVFVAQLPTYVRNTKRLTAQAMAVRDAVLNAREPSKLVFADLPIACGFDAITADATMGNSTHAFIRILKSALDELRLAYPSLQERVRSRLREAFQLPDSSQQSRCLLAGRSQDVLLSVTESKLRAFCLRLLDDNLPESEWLESIGSYVALKPPSKWHDQDEDLFNDELMQVATRFSRVESILFATGKSEANTFGVRVAITQSNGVEHEQVVHFGANEESQLRGLQEQFVALFEKDRRLALAAASRAIWASFEKGNNDSHG
jgi:hypothetical protein